LSKIYSIPHIPILIDPWVDIVYYKNLNRSKLAKRIDNNLEKSVLRNAKQVIFVTKSTEEDYLNKYEFLKNKANVLYWGYDEDDFKDLKVEKIKKDEKIIVHAGNLFAYQNPKNFWKQIKIENDRDSNFKIRFIGTVDPMILDYLKEIGLQDKVEIFGFLPYPEMVKEILYADALLVCTSEPRHVPGKLFEALRTGNPIIAFGDNNTEVKQIIESANAGMMFGYKNSGEEFLKFLNNFTPDYDKAKIYDRAKISEVFYKIIT
jgi:glycosyltransferase involved in cell wall biosynthesis